MRTILLLAVLTGPLAGQDEVTLRDGTLLHGKVAAVHAGGVDLRAGGTVRRIAWTALGGRGLVTEEPLSLHLANGDRLSGRITGWDGQALVLASGILGEVRVPPAGLAPAPPPAGREAASSTGGGPALEPAPWSGKVALSGTLRAGNVASRLFELKASATRQWTADRFLVEAALAHGEAEYKGRPPPDTRSLDLKLLAGIVYRF